MITEIISSDENQDVAKYTFPDGRVSYVMLDKAGFEVSLPCDTFTEFFNLYMRSN